MSELKKCSGLTLDEAIEHCLEKARDESECGGNHKQLAEWLIELKSRRYDHSGDVDG